MDIVNLIISVISTIAAVVSAVAAVSAKNKVKELQNQITGNGNFQNSGKTSVENKGDNHGVVSGVNTGEIRN